MIETLLLPFQFAFMQKAFLMAAIISVPCALLSCFLVLKGWSLMGDAISHAVLPGIVLAYIAGIPLIIGAFGAGMFCALAVGYLDSHSRVKQDTVMGVVFSGMFGFGMVLYTKISSDVHLDHILFGNVLGISGRDLMTSGLIAVLVSAVTYAKRRDLLLFAFDPAAARSLGLPVGWLHYGLLAMLSLTIVATLSSVGLILAIALLIAPGAIAFLLARRFETMLPVAVGVTVLAGQTGIYVSFFIDSAPAPTIVLILTAVFIAAFIRKMIRVKRASRQVLPI